MTPEPTPRVAMTKARQEEVLAFYVGNAINNPLSAEYGIRVSIHIPPSAPWPVATLHGTFTPDELEALAWFMRERQAVKETT